MSEKPRFAPIEPFKVGWGTWLIFSLFGAPLPILVAGVALGVFPAGFVILTIAVGWPFLVCWFGWLGLVALKVLFQLRASRAVPRATHARVDLSGLCYAIRLGEDEIAFWATSGPLAGNKILVVLCALGSWGATALLVAQGLPWFEGVLPSSVSTSLAVLALVTGSVAAACSWYVFRSPGATELLLEAKGPLIVHCRDVSGRPSELVIEREQVGVLRLDGGASQGKSAGGGIRHRLILESSGGSQELITLHGLVMDQVRGDLAHLSEELLQLTRGREEAEAALADSAGLLGEKADSTPPSDQRARDVS